MKAKALHFVQQFGDGCWMKTPAMCNQPECKSRSIATYQDDEHNAFYLCEKHRVELGAPLPTPGVEYAPTMALMNGWMLVNGVPAIREGYILVNGVATLQKVATR